MVVEMVRNLSVDMTLNLASVTTENVPVFVSIYYLSDTNIAFSVAFQMHIVIVSKPTKPLSHWELLSERFSVYTLGVGLQTSLSVLVL